MVRSMVLIGPPRAVSSLDLSALEGLFGPMKNVA